MLASRWDNPQAQIPLGSLVKPFTALAYGEHHAFRYPAHFCRGTATGCWLPHGHGEVDLPSAIAYSCNSYFRALTANMTAADVSSTAMRFGLEPPPPETAGPALAGLGNRWLISPLSMARAYLEFVRRRDQPGVRQILAGMAQSARQGTGAEVDRALPFPDALVKTGTAMCTHAKRAPGDGFTIVMSPSDDPQILLDGSRARSSRSTSRQNRGTDVEPYRTMTCRVMACRTVTPSVRIRTIVLVTLMLAGVFVHAQDVRVGVLGLFRPHEFTLSPLAGSALVVHVGAESVVLEASSGVNIAHISVGGDKVVLAVGTRVLRGSEVTVTSRDAIPPG